MNGRERGAIGIFYPISKNIEALTMADAVEKFFSEYEPAYNADLNVKQI